MARVKLNRDKNGDYIVFECDACGVLVANRSKLMEYEYATATDEYRYMELCMPCFDKAPLWLYVVQRNVPYPHWSTSLERELSPLEGEEAEEETRSYEVDC